MNNNLYVEKNINNAKESINRFYECKELLKNMPHKNCRELLNEEMIKSLNRAKNYLHYAKEFQN